MSTSTKLGEDFNMTNFNSRSAQIIKTKITLHIPHKLNFTMSKMFNYLAKPTAPHQYCMALSLVSTCFYPCGPNNARIHAILLCWSALRPNQNYWSFNYTLSRYPCIIRLPEDNASLSINHVFMHLQEVFRCISYTIFFFFLMKLYVQLISRF